MVIEIISRTELHFRFQNIWNTALNFAYLTRIWNLERKKFILSTCKVIMYGRASGLVDSIAAFESRGLGSIPWPANLFFLFIWKIQIFMRKAELRAMFQILLDMKRSSFGEMISRIVWKSVVFCRLVVMIVDLECEYSGFILDFFFRCSKIE